jgi:hypothetical protein
MCGKVRGVVSLGCGKEGCGKDQGVGRIRAWEKFGNIREKCWRGKWGRCGSVGSAWKRCGKVGSAREVPGGRRVKKGREGEVWEAGEEGGNENYEVLNKTFWRNN